MFKVLKYILYAGLYKKMKRNFNTLFVAIIILILFNLIISDLMSVTKDVTIYSMVTLKWILNLSLLGLIVFNFSKIINVAMNPFSSKEIKGVTSDNLTRENKILSKDVLFTKSDLILQKYMKD